MTIRSIITFCIFILWSVVGSAYIPSAEMILDRVAKNHGKGVYALDLEVQIKDGDSWKVNKEKWYVSSDRHLRVAAWSATEPQMTWKYNFIYRDNIKHFTVDGKLMKQKIGSDFMEGVFHSRHKMELVSWLIQQNILEHAGQIARNPRREGVKFIYPRETHLRLGRSGGLVAYVFAKRDTELDKNLPGLWIEQDQFKIIKARLASGAEFKASDFQQSGDLHFPRVRELYFDNQEIRIKLLNISKLKDSAATREIFNLNQLKEKTTIFSNDPVVRSFYERFR